MCFKTAGLAAPAENKATEFSTDNFGATISYQATGVREVYIAFGGTDSNGTVRRGQYAEASDLRQIATHLNELADKLEA